MTRVCVSILLVAVAMHGGVCLAAGADKLLESAPVRVENLQLKKSTRQKTTSWTFGAAPKEDGVR